MKNKKIGVFVLGIIVLLTMVVFSHSHMLFEENNILDTARVSKIGIPKIGEMYTLELKDIDGTTIKDIDCRIVNKPEKSVSELSIELDGTMSFILDYRGQYITQCKKGRSKRLISVTANNTYTHDDINNDISYPYDAKKISNYDGVTPLDEVVGSIENQFWVKSFNLDKEELEKLVTEYSLITTIGFDKTLGMLVEFDDTNPVAKEQLEKLKLEPGVDSVFNRMHVGENVDLTTFHDTIYSPVLFSGLYFR